MIEETTYKKKFKSPKARKALKRSRFKKAPRMNKGLGRPKKRARKGKSGRRNDVKELDRLFSLWIRQKYADKDGMVKCYTSGKLIHWTKLHCGHYLSRVYKSVRWDENNARPQSFAENIWKHGNPIEFRINLVAEIGEDAVKALEARRNELFRPSKEYFSESIAKYTEKVDKLLKENK